MRHNRHLMRATMLGIIGLLGLVLYGALCGTAATVSQTHADAIPHAPRAHQEP